MLLGALGVSFFSESRPVPFTEQRYTSLKSRDFKFIAGLYLDHNCCAKVSNVEIPTLVVSMNFSKMKLVKWPYWQRVIYSSVVERPKYKSECHIFVFC